MHACVLDLMLVHTCRYRAATGDDQQKSREVLLDGIYICTCIEMMV